MKNEMEKFKIEIGAVKDILIKVNEVVQKQKYHPALLPIVKDLTKIIQDEEIKAHVKLNEAKSQLGMQP